MLHKPQAIFFDWDGTLVDSLPALTSYYNHVLAKFDMPLMSEHEARKRIRLSAREIFPTIFGNQADKAFEIYYDIVAKTHLQKLKPFPDSEDLLMYLKSLNIPMGVISNKKHSFLNEEIRHLGWDKYLIANIGAGVTSRDKPSPEPLLKAMGEVGLESGKLSIWYVGDTEVDMQAAEAAHIQGIFIEHGMGIAEDISHHNLNPYFVKDTKALKTLIQKLF